MSPKNFNDVEFEKYKKHSGVYYCVDCKRILFYMTEDAAHYFDSRKSRNLHCVFGVEDPCRWKPRLY